MSPKPPLTFKLSAEAASYISRASLRPADLARNLANSFRCRETLQPLFLLAVALLGLASGQRLLQLAALLAIAAALLLPLRFLGGEAVGLLAADDQGRVVGGLRLRLKTRRRVIYIAGLYVEPQARRLRIAEALIEELLRRAEAEGDLELRPLAPSHPAARRLVRRYFPGYRRCYPAGTGEASLFRR